MDNILTIPDFCAKYELTYPQVKSSCFKGTFDSVLDTKPKFSGRGGARRRLLVIESEKTLAQVAKIKLLGRANKTTRPDEDTCPNGVEILVGEPNVMALEMMGTKALKYAK